MGGTWIRAPRGRVGGTADRNWDVVGGSELVCVLDGMGGRQMGALGPRSGCGSERGQSWVADVTRALELGAEVVAGLQPLLAEPWKELRLFCREAQL